jgi:aryl-alcohol dehydrogenase-like predicted oxidoreductase
MKYEALGRTGVTVSRLCLGTMMFGAQGNPDHDDSVRVIRAALDAGINFLDTADVYSYGESEEIVGKAVAGRRDDVVIATKVHHPMSDEVMNRRGSSRAWIVKACEDSLRRLGTDYIDLYQVHRPDPLTDIDETLGALSDLVHQGKVRMIGCCTFPPAEIVESQWVAKERGYARFRCNQPPYSIFTRGIEREVLDVCHRYGMGVITWSPLNGGWLAGRYRRGVVPGDSPRNAMPMNRVRDEQESGFGKPRPSYPIATFDETTPENQRRLTMVDQLDALSRESGIAMSRIALGFVLAHPAVTSAIIGPRTMEQLVDQLPAGDLDLDNDVLDAIDAIVAPGTNVFEMGYVARELTDSWRRRRVARR